MSVLSFCLVAAFLLGQASSQEIPVFRTTVEAVTIDIFVGRNGKSLTDLTGDDFEVFDNGILQEVELLRSEAVPLSVIFVLDVSSSVHGQKLEHLRSAAAAFLEELEAKDQAALLTFSVALDLRSELTADHAAVRRTLDGIEARGGTALKDALYGGLKAAEGLERPVLVLFTDGRDTFSWLTEDEVFQTVRESNAVVYAVSTAEDVWGPDDMSYLKERRGEEVTPERSPENMFLERAALFSGGALFKAGSSKKLEKQFLDILRELRTRYLLTYYPHTVSEDGWHAIEVKVKRSGAEVRARQGYFRVSQPE